MMYSMQNCNRSLRRLVWLLFCFVMLDPLSPVWSQSASDRDQLLRGLTEFESKFFGKEVDVICHYPGGSKASTRYLRETHFLSHDGRITAAIQEFELTSPKTKTETYLSHRMISNYDNGSYSVSTHQELNTDEPLVFFADTTVARGGVADSQYAYVFGFSGDDGERLSQIAGREGSRIRRVSEKRFGSDVITFQVDVPKFGNYAFSFREIPDTDNSKQASEVVGTTLQLVGYSVKKSVGHIYRNGHKQVTLGSKKPKNSFDDWLYGIRGVELTIGPISYDTEGYPKTVGVAYRMEGDYSYNVSGAVAEVTSIRPLKIRLREDEICFAGITAKIPEGAKVTMINPTGEVYEIRGRQLVKKVDGKAVSVSKNSGFRAPSSSVPYVAGLGFAAVLLLVIYIWLRNR